MSPAFEHIKKEISTLPARERYSLWRDLSTEFDPPVADDHDEDEETVEAAWDEEIAKRVKEIEDGTVELLSAEEVEKRTAALFTDLGLAQKPRPLA